MKRIVLCADDYGQASHISRAIIELANDERLTATSCLVTSNDWQSHAKWLQPLSQKIDMGLHFNLTEGVPLSPEFTHVYGEQFLGLQTVLRQSLLKKIQPKAVLAECRNQIERFRQCLGFLPHYIDGHQHVHQFPIIRDAVIAIYREYYPDRKAYVRLINEKINVQDFWKNFKKLIILATGSQAMQRLLQQHRIPHNMHFAGIYPFKKSAYYPTFFRQFLQNLPLGGVIMTHPGWNPNGPASRDDTIAASRLEEYRYLASSQFKSDCEAQGVELSRFRELIC